MCEINIQNIYNNIMNRVDNISNWQCFQHKTKPAQLEIWPLTVSHTNNVHNKALYLQ